MRANLSAIAVAVVGLGLLAGPPVVLAGGWDDRRFSTAERRALLSGELVQRRVRQRRGQLDLMGGTAWQVIDAPAERVWEALLDTPRYHRFMPQVLEARLGDRAPGERTVYMRQGQGFIQADYYLKVTVDHGDHDIAFTIDESRPHDLKAAFGFYTVRPYGPDRSLLAYGVMADIGDGLVAAAARGTVHEWMLKVPWMVKRFVEGSGRYIYR